MSSRVVGGASADASGVETMLGGDVLPPIAEFGALSPEVVGDIAILQRFFENRDRLMTGLFGVRLRRNPTRDELLRHVMLEFGQGRHRNMAFYVQICAYLATEPSIRSELDLLAHRKLIRIIGKPGNKRAKVVAPTARLVTFYNTQMPSLRTEVMALLEMLPGTVKAVTAAE